MQRREGECDEESTNMSHGKIGNESYDRLG
jgi:hypothetical protein